tara:strand:- start:254 stop:982 length:729 start_codon:yes stop_codon:yes gene_type:complete
MHIGVVILLLHPNILNRAYNKLGLIDYMNGHSYYMKSLWDYYSNRSKTLDPNSDQLVFFGDSMINGLCVESYFGGVNFGISGETLRRAKSRITEIHNLENKKIVLAYGINDLPCDSKVFIESYKELIDKLPHSASIYISSLLPVNESILKEVTGKVKSNAQIDELNMLLEDYCTTHEAVYFLDSSKYLLGPYGQLSEKLQKGDGLHFNLAGNLLWAKGIEEGLKKANFCSPFKTSLSRYMVP